MIDYDEIRKQVAMEHNFLIAKDDPLLASVTLNELVFQRYVEIVEEKNEAYRKAIDTALQKGIADAKVAAGIAITEGSDYASERIRDTVKAVLAQAEAVSLPVSSNPPPPLLSQAAFWWGAIAGSLPFLVLIVWKIFWF